jgi:hypothetical protein
VTATQIGVALGGLRADTAAALVSAGLLSVVIFALVALTLLGRTGPAETPDPVMSPA